MVRVEEGGEDYADGDGEEGEGGFALLEVSLWGGVKEGGVVERNVLGTIGAVAGRRLGRR